MNKGPNGTERTTPAEEGARSSRFQMVDSPGAGEVGTRTLKNSHGKRENLHPHILIVLI
jgi:hypothetical protein